MQSTPPVRSSGPDHRSYEEQQPGRYRPEAPQSAHEVVTLLSQLDDLEVARRTARLYEEKVAHVWDEIRGFHSLLAGFVPPTLRKPEHEGDLQLLRGLVDGCRIDPSLIPENPIVELDTAESDANFHTYSIGTTSRGTRLKVLREDYQGTFSHVYSRARENYFIKVWAEALPSLATAQAVASKWGLWGPKSRLYRTEITNSLDRIRDIINERVAARQLDRAAAAKGAGPVKA